MNGRINRVNDYSRKTCPYCGGDRLKQLRVRYYSEWAKEWSDKEQLYYECRRCGRLAYWENVVVRVDRKAMRRDMKKLMRWLGV
jgi:ribosomal protein L37E